MWSPRKRRTQHEILQESDGKLCIAGTRGREAPTQRPQGENGDWQSQSKQESFREVYVPQSLEVAALKCVTMKSIAVAVLRLAPATGTHHATQPTSHRYPHLLDLCHTTLFPPEHTNLVSHNQALLHSTCTAAHGKTLNSMFAAVRQGTRITKTKATHQKQGIRHRHWKKPQVALPHPSRHPGRQGTFRAISNPLLQRHYPCLFLSPPNEDTLLEALALGQHKGFYCCLNHLRFSFLFTMQHTNYLTLFLLFSLQPRLTLELFPFSGSSNFRSPCLSKSKLRYTKTTSPFSPSSQKKTTISFSAQPWCASKVFQYPSRHAVPDLVDLVRFSRNWILHLDSTWHCIP